MFKEQCTQLLLPNMSVPSAPQSPRFRQLTTAINHNPVPDPSTNERPGPPNACSRAQEVGSFAFRKYIGGGFTGQPLLPNCGSGYGFLQPTTGHFAFSDGAKGLSRVPIPEAAGVIQPGGSPCCPRHPCILPEFQMIPVIITQVGSRPAIRTC
jgi:hypothetical protein